MTYKGDRMNDNEWIIYKGDNTPHDGIEGLPKAPPWRNKNSNQGTESFIPLKEEIEMVNAALYLRRPLLITGKPGVGKSALAKSIAHELKLGDILSWHITTKTTLKDALYEYDAIARLHDTSINPKEKLDIGKYITLGALGTAFTSDKIRVILIDEIDKSDIDLPNDLLHVLEENRFIIPELLRSNDDEHNVSTCSGTEVTIKKGAIEANPNLFPLIIMTSNGEREFPPAFMRRCIHMEMKPRSGVEELKKIIQNHIDITTEELEELDELLHEFNGKDKDSNYLSVDQLLNAVFLKLKGVDLNNNNPLLNNIWKALSV